MELDGYAGYGAAGVAHVALIGATKVTGAEFDPQTGSCVSVSVAAGAGFRECRFREGSASYREVWGGNGKPQLVHELSFRIGGMDCDSRLRVEELIRKAPEGLVALVKMETGGVLLVGCSERFGAEQPLMLESADGNSGQRPGDGPGEMLRLVSRDADKAYFFTGEIPWADGSV